MELEQFVDTLIKERGFGEQDPEVIAQIKEDIIASIETRMNALVLSLLAPEDLEEFEGILDTGTPEDAQQFVHTRIPEFDEKAALELLSFRASYLS